MSDIGRRCSRNCATWPDDEGYAVCPGCDGATRRFRGLTPLSCKEAESVALRLEFEKFYATEWVPDVEADSDLGDLQGLLSA